MSEDPLGDLERELVAAARRQAQSFADVPRSEAEALSGALAMAFAGFAIALVVGVLALFAIS